MLQPHMLRIVLAAHILATNQTPGQVRLDVLLKRFPFHKTASARVAHVLGVPVFVMLPLVALQRRRLPESQSAHVATMHRFLVVRRQMPMKISPLRKGVVTLRTLIRLLASVRPHVDGQRGGVRESLGADLARIRFDAVVRESMVL